jgi:hypothetical protein
MELLSRGSEMAEPAHRLFTRGVRRPAGPYEIGDAHLEVAFNLEIHLGVRARASTESQVE